MTAQAFLRAAVSVTVATAAVALLAGRAEAQVAAPGGGQVVATSPRGQVVAPPSSIVKPADLGLRAHTNVLAFIPAGTAAGKFLPKGTARPKVGPPYAGYWDETPASVACAYEARSARLGLQSERCDHQPDGRRGGHCDRRCL